LRLRITLISRQDHDISTATDFRAEGEIGECKTI
jgi:hypothetical protein